jgi:hypothetical protein
VTTRDFGAPSAAYPLQGALALCPGGSLVPHAGEKLVQAREYLLGGMVPIRLRYQTARRRRETLSKEELQMSPKRIDVHHHFLTPSTSRS